MKHVIIGNRLSPSGFIENVAFSEDMPYYLCIKHLFVDDIVIPHYASSIEILVCDGVEGTFVADKTQFSLSGKKVLYIPPNCVHSNNFKKGDGVMYVLKISPEHMGAYLNIDKLLRRSDSRSIYCEPFVCDLYSEIMEYVRELTENDGKMFSCIRSIMDIFALLKDHMNPSVGSDNIISSATKNTQLKNLIDYTEKNILCGLSNKVAAGYIGYNENYFCRWFLRMTGMTYNDYLMHLRINYACKKLEENVPVREIVTDLGYVNSSFFTRKFKEYTGYTPGEYARSADRIHNQKF